jgi:cell division protein FtsQ
MASSSGRRSGSSGRSSSRERVVIGAQETTRVRYAQNKPRVESERRNPKKRPSQGKNGEAQGKKRPSSSGRKVADQKRDQREQRRRSISRRRFLVGALVVALVLGVIWGAIALWDAPIFTIDSVQITGLSHLKDAEVRSLAAVSADDTLLKIATKQIAARVKTSPWVADASVTRTFPHTLAIAVTERVPFAVVDAQGAGQWLVTSDGYWIVAKTNEQTAGIMPIRDVVNLKPRSGEKVNSTFVVNALAVLSGISPQLRAKTKYISAATIEKTMLVLDNGVQVFIGDSSEIKKKDLTVRGILDHEKNVVYINVRVPESTVVRNLGSKE